MSGTVLSRTDRHTQYSSGAARSATALRRTGAPPASATSAPVATRPADGDPAHGDPASDTDTTDADPATSALVAPPRPAPPGVAFLDPVQPDAVQPDVARPDAVRPDPAPVDAGHVDPEPPVRSRAAPDPTDQARGDLDPPGPGPAGWAPATPTPATSAPSPSAPATAAASSFTEPTAALTVTLAIPLNGEALTPQTRRLLDALRELVEVGQGSVTTTAAPARATASDNGASAPPVHLGPTTAAPVGSDPNAAGPVNGTHAVNGTFGTDTVDAGSLNGGSLNGGSVNGGSLNGDGRFDGGRSGVDGVGASTGYAPRPPMPTAVNPAEVRLLTASRQVLLGGEPLAMTRLEFDLLLFLAGNPRRVFTRAQLLGAVWGYEHTGERTVDVHVRRLRVKMGVQVPLITTVYGVGYRLDDDARIVVVAHE